MESAINRISLSGFKSIQSLHDFPLLKLNVLIGANGAGKSNFVNFFRMLTRARHWDFSAIYNRRGRGRRFPVYGTKNDVHDQGADRSWNWRLLIQSETNSQRYVASLRRKGG